MPEVLSNMGIGRARAILEVAKKLYGNYKFRILILIALGFLSGVTEALGIGVLVPVFSFVVKGGVLGTDFISKTIVGLFSYFNVQLHLYSLIGLICFLFILKAFTLLLFNYVNVLISADYENNMKRDIYKDTLSASWPYLMKQKIGYLEFVLITQVGFVVRLFQQISNNILALTSFITYTVVAFKLSRSVTVITLLFGVFIVFVFRPLIVKTKNYSKKRSKLEAEINHYINENVIGVKTIKAMGVEKEVKNTGHEYFDRLKDMRVTLQIIKNWGSVFIQPLGFIFISLVFLFFYLRPNFDFGVFIAVMYLIERLFAYVDKIQGSSYVISEAIPYVNNLVQFQADIARHRESNEGDKPFALEEFLEFKNVNFSYNDGQEVLHNISFKIKKGEMTGIIGPSGAGKTTFVDLLLRLFKPQSGEILLDGLNANEIHLSEWRKNIGYVSQDIFLKNDTVLNNIKFFDNSIKEEDVVYGAKLANIHDFITTLPEKYNTLVGERGVLLSAGQRQRIVLARVLARHPKILVLDEATSALDNESETMIKKAIDGLKGEMTVIVIAHRLSTIVDSDRLIGLENGRIIEEGSPDKLLKDKNSYFYKVYNIV